MRSSLGILLKGTGMSDYSGWNVNGSGGGPKAWDGFGYGDGDDDGDGYGDGNDTGVGNGDGTSDSVKEFK